MAVQHLAIPEGYKSSYLFFSHFRGRAEPVPSSHQQLDPPTQSISSDVVDTSSRLQIIDDNEFPEIERAIQSSLGINQNQQIPGQQEEVNQLTPQCCK